MATRSPEMGDDEDSNEETRLLKSEIIQCDESSNVFEELDIDEVLIRSGGFGRFQLAMLIALMYLVLTIGQHFVLSVFIGADPPWRCIYRNSSTFCAKYYGRDIASDSDLFSKRCTLARDEWEFTTNKDYSFVTEYQLVCDKTYLAALASSAVYIGGMIGSMIAGSAGDAYGRKPVLLASLLLVFSTSLSCAYITKIWELILLRGVLGAASVACYFSGFVMLTEFVTPATRTITSNVYIMSLTCSHMVIDLWAYFERRWRYLQCQSSFPCLLAFLVLLFLPESPRWLLASNKIDRAKATLQTVAKVNDAPPLNIDLKLPLYPNEGVNSYSYFDLLRKWRVLVVTFSIGILWLTIGLVYYALALEAASFGGDMYKTFALTSCADMPSFLTSAYTCDKFGRKKSNLVSLSIAGVLIGSLAIIPQALTWKYVINTVIVMTAKFFTENAFNGIYTWSSEIFPTVLRSQGISVCVIFQRLGLLVVPFLTTMLQSVSYMLPFIFMFALSLCASFIGLILPETNKKPTRESYDDFFEEEGRPVVTYGGI